MVSGYINSFGPQPVKHLATADTVQRCPQSTPTQVIMAGARRDAIKDDLWHTQLLKYENPGQIKQALRTLRPDLYVEDCFRLSRSVGKGLKGLGARFEAQAYQCARSQAGLPTGEIHVIQGFPLDMAEAELKDILADAHWITEPMMVSRRVRGRMAHMRVRSAAPPPHESHDILRVISQDEVITLHILPLIREKPVALKEPDLAPQTWSDAFKRALGKTNTVASQKDSAAQGWGQTGHSTPATATGMQIDMTAMPQPSGPPVPTHPASREIQPLPLVHLCKMTRKMRKRKMKIRTVTMIMTNGNHGPHSGTPHWRKRCYPARISQQARRD